MTTSQNQGQNCRIGRVLIVLDFTDLNQKIPTSALKEEEKYYEKLLDKEYKSWYPNGIKKENADLRPARWEINDKGIFFCKGFLGYKK